VKEYYMSATKEPKRRRKDASGNRETIMG